MDITVHFPIIIVLIGIFASFIIPAANLYKIKIGEIISLASIALMFVLGIYLRIQLAIDGPFTYHIGGWPAPWGIEFKVDYLGAYMVLIITGIGFLTLFYATKDLAHDLTENAQGIYYPLYILLIAAMAGMAITNDIFNLFVLLEVSLLSSVAIICIKENEATIEASLKYLILNALGSAAVLLGIALLYMITGHLNMTFIAVELQEVYPQYMNVIIAAMALFLVGFGVKAALFPMHVWLPDAHGSAPSPSSAVLSGLVIKIYTVSLIRIYFQVIPRAVITAIPIMEIVLWLAAIGIILGSMFAIVQDDIKKLLAYSSVAQIGYVFLGISLMSFTGFQGGLIHILNHAFIKAMLFLSAGVIIYSTGLRKINDLKGIGFKLPFTMTCFTLGGIAMIGIPGTNGFISKWYLALGALEAGRPIFVLVLLVSSMLNGVYYLPIIVNSFFGETPEGFDKLKIDPVPWQMKFTLLVLAFGVVFFGIFPSLPLGILESATEYIYGS
ncbi:complex I subunit 5 family protein [Natranaerofaba carboxydovora]|uniref:complex I subunit 5 family protein n=1 Tax=Natranaerofaba carboxydovora TaxID=2742683 RepID=UPI001F1451F2|nr:monovalent cation/H+ antiporter subunit D family protein [Natranaerofaba carboxydovora]UMZ72859.1 Na(+)/H(+) antiporter subunit D [Natranaerofaba carboxydovora]